MNLDILTTVDTPTISNALDMYRGDRSAEGFTKFPVVCSNKNLKPIIGVAKTAKIRANTCCSNFNRYRWCRVY